MKTKPSTLLSIREDKNNPPKLLKISINKSKLAKLLKLQGNGRNTSLKEICFDGLFGNYYLLIKKHNNSLRWVSNNHYNENESLELAHYKQSDGRITVHSDLIATELITLVIVMDKNKQQITMSL